MYSFIWCIFSLRWSDIWQSVVDLSRIIIIVIYVLIWLILRLLSISWFLFSIIVPAIYLKLFVLIIQQILQPFPGITSQFYILNLTSIFQCCLRTGIVFFCNFIVIYYWEATTTGLSAVFGGDASGSRWVESFAVSVVKRASEALNFLSELLGVDLEMC